MRRAAQTSEARSPHGNDQAGAQDGVDKAVNEAEESSGSLCLRATTEHAETAVRADDALAEAPRASIQVAAESSASEHAISDWPSGAAGVACLYWWPLDAQHEPGIHL